MTCVRVCLGFLQITIRRARGCDHWPWGWWSHAASCSCFWVDFWGDFDSGSLDDTPVRELGGHSPKSPRVPTPLKQCRESGPMNRAVRTIRGRRTRSWWHCTERAATRCQSCGANPAGHARRTRWASTSESGAVTASTAQDRTEGKQSRRRATSACAGLLRGLARSRRSACLPPLPPACRPPPPVLPLAHLPQPQPPLPLLLPDGNAARWEESVLRLRARLARPPASDSGRCPGVSPATAQAQRSSARGQGSGPT